MPSDTELELYRTHRAAQERYTYFMLAGVGAAIAFALTQTQKAPLAWSQIPLGLCILAWGCSFFSGCMHLQYVGSTLYANFNLLKVESGQYPGVGSHPQMIAAASDGIRQAIEKNSSRAAIYATMQFRLLVGGAAFYIGWHIFEMYLRTS